MSGKRLGVGVGLLQAVDHLLREQRVAAGPLSDPGDQPGVAAVALVQRSDQALGVVLGERLEGDRGRVAAAPAPVRAAVEQLVARQADDQQRPAHPAGEVLDQVEHPLVCPVDVLDRQQQRLARAHPLGQGADRGEERLAHPLRVLRLAAGGLGRLEAEDDADRGDDPLRLLGADLVGEQLSDAAAELLPGGVGGLVGGDPELRAQHLGQRPVGDPRAERRALADLDRRGWVELGGPLGQLAQQPRLADPGLAEHGDQMRPSLALELLGQREQHPQLVAAADQGRADPRLPPAVSRAPPAPLAPPRPGPAPPSPSARVARARRMRSTRGWRDRSSRRQSPTPGELQPAAWRRR